jgi:hypothetical protein
VSKNDEAEMRSFTKGHRESSSHGATKRLELGFPIERDKSNEEEGKEVA